MTDTAPDETAEQEQGQPRRSLSAALTLATSTADDRTHRWEGMTLAGLRQELDMLREADTEAGDLMAEAERQRVQVRNVLEHLRAEMVRATPAGPIATAPIADHLHTDAPTDAPTD